MPVKSSTSPVPEDSAAVRPLPQPTLASAEFWTAGADGVLTYFAPRAAAKLKAAR